MLSFFFIFCCCSIPKTPKRNKYMRIEKSERDRSRVFVIVRFAGQFRQVVKQVGSSGCHGCCCCCCCCLFSWGERSCSRKLALCAWWTQARLVRFAGQKRVVVMATLVHASEIVTLSFHIVKTNYISEDTQRTVFSIKEVCTNHEHSYIYLYQVYIVNRMGLDEYGYVDGKVFRPFAMGNYGQMHTSYIIYMTHNICLFSQNCFGDFIFQKKKYEFA